MILLIIIALAKGEDSKIIKAKLVLKIPPMI